MTKTDSAIRAVSHWNGRSPPRRPADIFVPVISARGDSEAGAFVMSGHFIWNPQRQTTQKEQRQKRALFAFGNALPMNRPTPTPSQEGSRRSSAPGQFPSWERFRAGFMVPMHGIEVAQAFHEQNQYLICLTRSSARFCTFSGKGA